MSRLNQLIRYMSKVFQLPELVKGVSATRDPSRIRISTSAVLLAWILGFCVQTRSREELGRLLDRRSTQRLIGCHISSDTLGRVLGQIDTDSLRSALLVPVVRQIRRNKAWSKGVFGKHILVGLDGSEAFCTQKQPCPYCSTRRLHVKDADGTMKEVTEHYHRAVCAFIIGSRPRIYLDIEPVRPGEGEVTAGMRLVTRLAKNYGRWISGIVADHGFAGAPFLNHVRKVGFHYIVRVKDKERRSLLKAAAAHCPKRKPDAAWCRRIGHKRLRVSAWDKDGLQAWRGLREPTRVVVHDESELAERKNRRRRKAEPKRQRPRAFLATSYPKAVLPVDQVWLAYHNRWQIENNGFRQLKQEWHWNHAFVHTACDAEHGTDALLNLWLLMILAVDIMEVFLSRRLAATRHAEIPLRAVVQEIAAQLLTFTPAQLPCWSSA